ncbi:fungal-specific transcription factor domain-containing protein [Bisporella sp. PMI_857]|nr:fungal-specific transcription factor domain-containing protein [Bisporella sp. PMI_857]
MQEALVSSVRPPAADRINLSITMLDLSIINSYIPPLGASSGFTLFSPQGLRWISERTGSNELSELITSFGRGAGGPWSQPKVNFWHPIPPCDREPLPSRELADIYVQGFFDHFNSIFPLYNRASFDEFLEHQYSGQPLGGVGWYASLNVVLCLGSMTLLVDECQSRGYFRNACGCFIDLMFKGSNLMALQAICGLAIIQQFYLEPQSIFILSATASRLAYAMGLHHKLDGFGLSQQEVQQRYNVFWIVYVMDKTIALRFGHPSVMRDDDIGIDLPHQDSLLEEYSDGLKRYNMFRYHAELAQLESRVYSELYSVRARSKSKSNRLAAVGELDKALQEWRLALPQEIRPGEPIQYAEEHFIPLAMMQFAYFNCLTTIHRSSIHHGSWTSDGACNDEATSHDPSLNPRVYASYSICLTAARKSIELLNMFDKKYSSGPGNLTWFVSCYQFSTSPLPRNSTLADPLTSIFFVFLLDLSPVS